VIRMDPTALRDGGSGSLARSGHSLPGGAPLSPPFFFPPLLLFSSGGQGQNPQGGGQGDEDGSSIYRAALGFSGRWMDGGQTLASTPQPHGGHPVMQAQWGGGHGGAAPCPTVRVTG
jgi:hypothetical protein